MVYKYLKCQDKVWSSILRYWYAVNIYSISGERWDNSYPHSLDIENIPSFFKTCLKDFKDYCSKHGSNLSDTVTSSCLMW